MLRAESTKGAKIPSGHELLDINETAELTAWISHDLQQLEARYADFRTNNSLKSSLRSDRE